MDKTKVPIPIIAIMNIELYVRFAYCDKIVVCSSRGDIILKCPGHQQVTADYLPTKFISYNNKLERLNYHAEVHDVF